MALYKTTTDQNVDTTWQNPTHYWDLPCGLLDLVENFTKLGVSVRKNSLLTFSIPKSLHKLYGEIHVNPVSKVNLHKLQKNIATDRFTTNIFWVVDYPKPARFIWSYTWHMAQTPHQFAFISPLGQGRH